MSRIVLVTCCLAALALGGCTTTPAPSPLPTIPATVAPLASPTPAPTASASPNPTVSPAVTASPPTRTPSATPSASASAVASEFPAQSVIVTFKVLKEEYRVLVVDPANIAIAQRLLAGKEAPPIPNGVVVRDDPGVNTGWSWHIDPQTFEFADITTEVCDGKPSFVEKDEISGDYFCPWSAKVIAIEPANK